MTALQCLTSLLCTLQGVVRKCLDEKVGSVLGGMCVCDFGLYTFSN